MTSLMRLSEIEGQQLKVVQRTLFYESNVERQSLKEIMGEKK